jgi:hypothetical protein
MDRKELEETFPGIDARQVERHSQLVELWHHCSIEDLASDLNILTQILAFKARQQELVVRAREDVLKGAGHDCGEWLLGGRCQLCGLQLAPAGAVDECVCRSCTHLASKHDAAGSCRVCGQEGCWS